MEIEFDKIDWFMIISLIIGFLIGILSLFVFMENEILKYLGIFLIFMSISYLFTIKVL